MENVIAVASPHASQVRAFLKWTLLVTLNAVMGFIAGVLTEHDSLADILAMISGIVTFICAYTAIDLWLVSNGRTELSRSLKTGVIVKMIMQVLPGVEVGAGAVAQKFVGLVGLEKGTIAQHGFPRAFLRTYVETDVVGVVLSAVVAVITATILYVRHLAARRKRRAAVG